MQSGETLTEVGAAFADPVFDAQTTFRRALEAMASPGKIVDVNIGVATPGGLDIATTALCLSLFDHETAVWLGDGVARQDVYDYLRFHCGCPIQKTTRGARFAVSDATANVPSLDSLDKGTDEQPELSATLILQVSQLTNDGGVTLSGPGIKDLMRLNAGGIPAHFWRERKSLQASFPRGVDVILTCGSSMAALPRSTLVEA